jgi:rRNA-processing protein EBP2
MPAMGKNTEQKRALSSKQTFKNPPARQAHGNGKEKSLSNGKESPKASLKTKMKGKAVPRSPTPVHSEEDEEGDYEDTDDSEDDGLDEEGMARLMKDPSLPWTETLSLSYPYTIDVDVHDDLNREVAL